MLTSSESSPSPLQAIQSDSRVEAAMRTLEAFEQLSLPQMREALRIAVTQDDVEPLIPQLKRCKKQYEAQRSLERKQGTQPDADAVAGHQLLAADWRALRERFPQHWPLTDKPNQQGRGDKAGNIPPVKAPMRLGRIMEWWKRGEFGLLRDAEKNGEVFWHHTAFSGVDAKPQDGDWVLFTDRFNTKKGKIEVRKGLLLRQHPDLWPGLSASLDRPTLLNLLKSGPAEIRPFVGPALLNGLAPVETTEALNAVVTTLDQLRRTVPDLAQEWLAVQLAALPPTWAAPLWLRTSSPWSAQPAIAEKLVGLLCPVDSALHWWPVAADTQPDAILLQALETMVDPAEGASEWVLFLRAIGEALGTQFAAVFGALLRRYLDLPTTRVLSEAEYDALYELCQKAPTGLVNVREALCARATDVLRLSLWLHGEPAELPRELAVTTFPQLTLAEQDRVAEQLADDDVLALAVHITRRHAKRLRDRLRVVFDRELLKRSAAVGLDIESDGTSLKEVAWGVPDLWLTAREPAQTRGIIEALRSRLALQDVLLVVGHNIAAFDAPILADHGVEIPLERQWDTLLVELALRPGGRVFALRTAHHAEADAALALRLFLNQTLRLLMLPDDEWEEVAGVLPPATTIWLKQEHRKALPQWLDADELQSEALSYFRPEPAPAPWSIALHSELDQLTAALRVIIVPPQLRYELPLFAGMRVGTSTEQSLDFGLLLEFSLVAHPLESTLVKRFFSHCRRSGVLPTTQAMAPALRARLSELVDLSGFLAPPTSWPAPGTYAITIEELRANLASLQAQPDITVLVVEPSLISLTRKQLLLELDTAEQLLNNPTLVPLWLRFSGGQSFVDLTAEQVSTLGAEIPPGFTHFWLEKHRHAQYRVWGTFPWEELLKAFAPDQLRTLHVPTPTFQAAQLRTVVFNQTQWLQQLGITPLNPETIYRSRYWLIQQRLIDTIGGIGAQNGDSPLLLLVQRAEEVSFLENYFRQVGCYIPEGAAAPGRRLELLHQSTRKRRLLIVPLADGPRYLAANYLGSLQVLVDSFNLLENYYLALGTSLLANAAPDAQQVDGAASGDDREDATTGPAQPVQGTLRTDLFLLLELQLPTVQYLRQLVNANHADNVLWLLDPRLGDFPGLATAWQASTVQVPPLWHTSAEFKQAATEADQCMPGPRPEELDLDVEQAKLALQRVFLGENGKWHDYQHPYLDKILPAKTDLLVSLPTGGGKSLLFQAPALYRSAFTNRLTIVVTPLKALMEDQVIGLWDRGFYSSVEYINQDRRFDLPQIYRRLAGGEISMLFLTPERFRSRGFRRAFEQRLQNDDGLEFAVFDEAHCISQWGQEFRPDYLFAARSVHQLRLGYSRRSPVLLFSATVSEKMFSELEKLFQ